MNTNEFDEGYIEGNWNDFLVVPGEPTEQYSNNYTTNEFYTYGKYFHLPERYVFDDYWYSGVNYNTDLYYRQMVVDRFRMDFCETKDTVPQFVAKYNSIIKWLMQFNPLISSDEELSTIDSNPFRILASDQTLTHEFGVSSYKKDSLVQLYGENDQFVDFALSDTDPVELFRQDPFLEPLMEGSTIYGEMSLGQIVAVCPIYDPRFSESTNVEVREIS